MNIWEYHKTLVSKRVVRPFEFSITNISIENESIREAPPGVGSLLNL